MRSMCTRYISPETREIEAYWLIGARTRSDSFQSARNLFPLATGPFVRNSADDGGRELVWSQWGMIPPDSETKIPMSRAHGPGEKPKRLSTINARTESVNSRPTYSGAWRAGQHRPRYARPRRAAHP